MEAIENFGKEDIRALSEILPWDESTTLTTLLVIAEREGLLRYRFVLDLAKLTGYRWLQGTVKDYLK